MAAEYGATGVSPVGLTRLGNPTNGNAPRPRGACRVLMIGDMIGKPGREAVERLLPDLREERGIDFVTANGDNVAGGMGLTPSTAESILASGVDVITSGNHRSNRPPHRKAMPVITPASPLQYAYHNLVTTINGATPENLRQQNPQYGDGTINKIQK